MSGAEAPGVVLVKLGGSLITEKGSEARARPEAIDDLARQLGEGVGGRAGGLVVGHGAGSFGHPPAARHRLHEGLGGPEERSGVSATQRAVAALHALVTERLREAGLPTFSIAPSGAAVAAGGRIADFAVEPVSLALRAGLVPVLHGDVVLDRRQGVAIASTESVFVELARRLPRHGWPVARVVWVGDTEGVYDEGGGLIPEITAEAGTDVPSAVGSPETDVTGGMAHRLETALRLARRGVPSWIGTASGDRVRRALGAETATGTRVVPPSGRPGED